MSIKNILDWSYWFHQPFIAVGFAKWFWILGFLALVLLGLVAKIARVYGKTIYGTTREALRRFGNLFLTTGLLGLLWMFFRQERVAFLAWRFWLVLWVVMFVWWAYKVVRFAIKRTPLISEEQAQKALKEKYLPKNK
ncbi:MAG: hypothetical protein ACD_72C00063G0001 [uncultured bacterium]|nr:MAG: hypothetical protein ACD_72C00063G0001 [uncultured bacterium]